MLVHNRTREKAAPLEALGARWSDNPLAECDRVVISLYTTDVVEQVLAELDAGLHAGLTLLDTTTGDPVQTPALGERLAARGVRLPRSPDFRFQRADPPRRGDGAGRRARRTLTLACRDLLDGARCTHRSTSAPGATACG